MQNPLFQRNYHRFRIPFSHGNICLHKNRIQQNESLPSTMTSLHPPKTNGLKPTIGRFPGAFHFSGFRGNNPPSKDTCTPPQRDAGFRDGGFGQTSIFGWMNPILLGWSLGRWLNTPKLDCNNSNTITLQSTVRVTSLSICSLHLSNFHASNSRGQPLTALFAFESFHTSWESFRAMPTPPWNNVLIKPNSGTLVGNNPLIRRHLHFLGRGD